MAAVNWTSRALGLNRDAWRQMESDSGITGAATVVVGTHALLAIDRFGWFGAPRATVRFVLIGLYSWLALALLTWAVARSVGRHRARPLAFVRLFGYAHLPLLAIAAILQVFAVNLGIVGIWRWPVLIAGMVWLPAVLARAVSVGADVRLRKAMAIAAFPYTAWLATLGFRLWSQLDHLL